MVFFHKEILGRGVNWRFATSSPEAEVSGESLHDTLKLNGLGKRGRPLRDFVHHHRLLLRVLVLTLVWELLAQGIGLLAVAFFRPQRMSPPFSRVPMPFSMGAIRCGKPSGRAGMASGTC